MKAEILIPYLIRETVDVTIENTSVGRCIMSDEIEFNLFGQPHILTFTIDENRDTKTLYYTVDGDSDSQVALREEEFNYRVIE